jgi:Cys-tRNA(Pro)/Cys-tRNA(Cys) deacylase
MPVVSAPERVTGYVAGGISPLGQKRPLRTVLDASALDHDTIFVSAGRRGLDLEIAPADLVAITGAITGQVGRR